MNRRYEAKHLAKKTIRNSCLGKLLIVAIMLCIFALENMSGIFSYLESKVSVVNMLSLAGQYTVHFDANGGVGVMPDQKIYIGQSVNLYSNTFTRDDLVFAGWNTSDDGTGTSYPDAASVNNLSTTDGAVVNLYAQWEDETNAAEVVGDRKYPTVQEAINAVTADNQKRTIKLLKNVELTTMLNISENKNIEFNLQNYKITNVANANINIIKTYGALEIIGGTIQSSSGFGAIDIETKGSLIVNGTRIITTGTRQAIYNNGGTVEITGNAYLSASATDRATVQNNKPTNGNAGTITISGGTIVSTGATNNRGAVENIDTGTVIVTGGTIISETKIGVDNRGGILIIGTEDGDVEVTSPVIRGATYGVNSTTATVEFYNGIVKGKTQAFNNENNITEIEDDSEIVHSSEVIDGNTYETAYLDSQNAKVIFDGNGGIPAETIAFVEEGTAIGTLPVVTRERHSFDGWFTAPTGGTQITSATIVSANIRYYAHWTKTQALVKFDAGDGTSSESTRDVNIGAALGALPNATQQYKTFAGWYTAETGGTQITASEIINDDITYYAHWNPINVTVTLDPNEGVIPTTTGWTIDQQDGTATKIVEAGNAVGTLPVPERTNWDFAGWYTTSSDGTRINESQVITDTVTYYAHWINDSVAAIGPNRYATLQDAIDDVPTDNTQTTITLLKDDLEAVNIAANKNIILDLDGHTLYNNGTKKAQSMNDSNQRKSVIENLGNLKIMNGTINNSDNNGNANQAAINTGTGTVTVENVTVTHTGTATNARKQAIYVYTGTLLVSGNSVIRANNAGAYKNINRGAIQNEKGTVIIIGGMVTSTGGPAIVNQANATVELGEKDGSIGNTTPVIQGKTNGIETNSTATFNFYDGIVKGITASINGTVSDTETGATRVDDTETIESDTYNTTYYQ